MIGSFPPDDGALGDFCVEREEVPRRRLVCDGGLRFMAGARPRLTLVMGLLSSSTGESLATDATGRRPRGLEATTGTGSFETMVVFAGCSFFGLA